VKVRVHRALQDLKAAYQQLQAANPANPGRAGQIPPHGVAP
jgi:hypothetical protein